MRIILGGHPFGGKSGPDQSVGLVLWQHPHRGALPAEEVVCLVGEDRSTRQSGLPHHVCTHIASHMLGMIGHTEPHRFGIAQDGLRGMGS